MTDTVDLAGWWHTQWGMTEEAMIKSLYDAKLEKTPREDYGDHYSDYVLRDAEIGGFKFKVVFQMSKKMQLLSRVLMRHELPIGTPQDAQVKAVFNTLVKDFGAPEMLDRPNHYRWMFPSTTIFLHTINLPNSLNLVSIIFDKAK